MIAQKTLAGGGDTAFKMMSNNAAMLGIDLIELLWIPRNRLPHHGVIDLIGYKVPIINSGSDIYEDERPDSEWIDGTVKFYPDDNGRCWGYVYDTEDNRELLASSLANGWFRIVDKSVRNEIIEYAKKKEYRTEPYPTLQTLVKKTINERESDETVKRLEREKLEMEERVKLLEEKLLKASGEKATIINKRIRGKKVKDQELVEDEK